MSMGTTPDRRQDRRPTSPDPDPADKPLPREGETDTQPDPALDDAPPRPGGDGPRRNQEDHVTPPRMG